MARRIGCAGSVALLAALLVVGCGSGSQDASTTKTTKAQWARQAFAICRRLGHEQQRRHYAFERAHGMSLGEPGQREQEQINTDFVMPYVERKVDELRALPVPEGEQGKIEQILKSMEEGIRVSRAHPDWLAAPTEAHPIPFAKTIELTAAYGIWDCGQA